MSIAKIKSLYKDIICETDFKPFIDKHDDIDPI